MAQFNAVNNDTISAVQGDILTSSGQVFGVTRAVANAVDVTIVGTWLEAVGIGRVGTAAYNEIVEVNCEGTVSLNGKLYLSASTPGKATATPPAYPYLLGVVLDKRTAGSTQKATILLYNQGCAPADTAMEAILGTPATGTITCIAGADLADNDRLTVSDGTQTVGVEYQVTQDVYSTGSIECVAKANILDNEGFTLNDGVNPATEFEFQVTPNLYSTGTITAVPRANIADNETITLDDGVNDPVVFEFHSNVDAYATGSITCVAKANLLNNESVTLDDGVNDPVTIEFQVYPSAQATGTITCVAKANLSDNETFTLDDSIHDPVVFEFQVTPNAYSTGSIEVVDYSILVDNDTVSIGDGENVVTFEFDVSGSYVPTGGFIPVHVNGLTSNDDVCTALVNAINGVTDGLTVSAGAVVAGVTTITNDEYGDFDVTITNGAAVGALTCTGLTGGSVFTPTGGAVVVVDISGDTTASDVAATVTSTIDAVSDTVLAISCDAAAAEVVNLLADADGFYNAAVTEDVSDAGFTVTGMSGGGLFTATGGDVVVCDISAATTDEDVATALAATIDGVTTALAITTDTLVGAQIPLINDAYGFYNDAITTTVADAGFIVSGMSGGSATTFAASGGAVEVIDITGDDTAAEVAATIKASINAVTTTLAITAGDITDATIALTNDALGAYNEDILTDVADAGFVVTGMAGGSDDTFTAAGGGVLVIDITAATTAQEVATAVRAAINAVTTTLAITAGAPVDGVVPLVNDAYGAYNDAIVSTVTDEGFVVAGMEGGSSFTPTATFVTINLGDLTDLTANGIAVATAAAILGEDPDLVIITPTTEVITVANAAAGAAGNVAMVETVTDAAFVCTGMSGGVDPITA